MSQTLAWILLSEYLSKKIVILKIKYESRLVPYGSCVLSSRYSVDQAQQVFGELVTKWFNFQCYSYGQMLNKSQNQRIVFHILIKPSHLEELR